MLETAVVFALLIILSAVGWRAYERRRGRTLAGRIRAHFGALDWQRISIVERRFPFHMRADLQRALEPLLAESKVSLASMIEQPHLMMEVTFAGLMSSGEQPLSLQFEEIDIGEDKSVQCVSNGVWLMRRGDMRLALL